MITVRYRLAEGKTLIDLATRINEIFGTANPESDQPESLLPRVSSPVKNGWVQTKMSDGYAKSIEGYVAANGLDGLVTDFQVLWPTKTEIINGEEVDTPAVYNDITWTERLVVDGVVQMRDIYDENGSVIGEEVIMVTKRIGDIA